MYTSEIHIHLLDNGKDSSIHDPAHINPTRHFPSHYQFTHYHPSSRSIQKLMFRMVDASGKTIQLLFRNDGHQLSKGGIDGRCYGLILLRVFCYSRGDIMVESGVALLLFHDLLWSRKRSFNFRNPRSTCEKAGFPAEFIVTNTSVVEMITGRFIQPMYNCAERRLPRFPGLTN
ncbi:uncharacterized protein SPPG_09372 [Spizellomyces punctatus DAOM BR117]|uniref:Uncharacterized protein n=1 Tax=Spizellomyces punctatus (strain DAOM BR117) TaxID=645134 RepID=A0A0L0HAH4_SPIPD|nr:uncharacterized protein SPPG_09372 [Spizellomyces punctatus DAOM BR117]KNC98011.1 hypothetical protein SPPG_09372 [Spizellomyces punctatus DAOM BR117]|eukprot:XP_016606051.1 hypothetical protein SPPG_09372 [Spizellomyces punctatus DAOM BR117]